MLRSFVQLTIILSNLPCRFLKERRRNVFTFVLLSALLSATLVPIFQFVVSSDAYRELASSYQSTYKRKGSTPGKVRAHMRKHAHENFSSMCGEKMLSRYPLRSSIPQACSASFQYRHRPRRYKLLPWTFSDCY